MGLFNDIEKGLATGAAVAGEFLQKAGENVDGWGQRADDFFTDEERWANVKASFEDVAAKFEDVVNKVKDEATKAEAEFMKDEDVVRPDTVDPDDCCGTEGRCCENGEAEAENARGASTVAGDEEVVSTVQEDGDIVSPTDKLVEDMTVDELREAAKELGIKGASILGEKELAILVKALS